MFKLFSKSVKEEESDALLADYMINYNQFRIPVFADMGHEVIHGKLKITGEDYCALFESKITNTKLYGGRVASLFDFVESNKIEELKSYQPVVAHNNYAYQDLETLKGNNIRIYSFYWQKRRTVYVLNCAVKKKVDAPDNVLGDFVNDILNQIKLKAV